MSADNIIRFVPRKKAERPAKPVKPAKIKACVDPWYRPRRYVPELKFNPNALASFDVTEKTKWPWPKRDTLATEVLKALLQGGVLGIDHNHPGRLYRIGKPKGVLTDRKIRTCCVKYLNFSKRGIPSQPPHWLAGALRLVSYNDE